MNGLLLFFNNSSWWFMGICLLLFLMGISWNIYYSMGNNLWISIIQWEIIYEYVLFNGKLSMNIYENNHSYRKSPFLMGNVDGLWEYLWFLSGNVYGTSMEYLWFIVV